MAFVEEKQPLFLRVYWGMRARAVFVIADGGIGTLEVGSKRMGVVGIMEGLVEYAAVRPFLSASCRPRSLAAAVK